MALGGLRYEPGETFAAGLWLGVGGQYEHYSKWVQVSVAKGWKMTSDAVTFTASLRVRLQWALVPRVLVVRLRSDAIRFQITRDTEVIDLGASIANPDRSVTSRQEGSQIDAVNRLFVDLEALSFAGFVPGLHGGLDVFVRTSEVADVTSVVPVAGVGIRREAF